MLDEEVVFKMNRQRPKSRLNTYGSNLFQIVAPVGLGVLAFLGVKEGLEYGTFLSLVGGVLGGFLGFAGSGETVDYISGVKDDTFNENENDIDESAMKNDASFGTLSYRENDLDIVLREDYLETGHMFKMSINDGIIMDPFLSYQPNRSTPLTFRFSLRAFNKPAYGVEEIFNAFPFRTDQEEESKEEGPFSDLLKNFNEILIQNQFLEGTYTQHKDRTEFVIKYKGENHETDCNVFINRCSSLMNLCYNAWTSQ
tara:strand:+ start:2568 stop:3332 length:765 start_codon:yes stop_codon:yes gene_type:complete